MRVDSSPLSNKMQLAMPSSFAARWNSGPRVRARTVPAVVAQRSAVAVSPVEGVAAAVEEAVEGVLGVEDKAGGNVPDQDQDRDLSFYRTTDHGGDSRLEQCQLAPTLH